MDSLCLCGDGIASCASFVYWAHDNGSVFSSITKGDWQKKVLHLVWLVVSVLLFGIFIPGSGGSTSAVSRAITEQRMDQIQSALLAYQTEYDIPPPGENNAALVKELEADNSRKIAFINLRPTDVNENGEVLDAWGTPFRISLTDHEHPLIQSAGPDKKWNTSDDVDNTKN